MNNFDFDVLIVGAGPAGCSTAISLAETGLRIAMLDKASFPREKICGDGLTIDTINQLQKLSPRLAENVKNFSDKISAEGCFITTTKGHRRYFELPANNKPYVIQRIHFDNELLKECRNYDNIHIFENTLINECSISDNQVKLTSSNGNFTGKIIVGADGANSLIAKFVNPNKVKETLNALCVRAYFSNVKDDEYHNVLEIHYIKELVNGYFWIFHMHNNMRNVGMGIDERIVKKNKIKMSVLFNDIINNNPRLKERFAEASMEGELKAYRIPAFNRYKKIYGDRVLLVGDAANIANPLSGEGVGNALRTGRFAAEQIKNCFATNNFSKEFNAAYYKKVKRTMFPELERHRVFAFLNKYTWLSNFILKHKTITDLLLKAFILTIIIL